MNEDHAWHVDDRERGEAPEQEQVRRSFLRILYNIRPVRSSLTHIERSFGTRSRRANEKCTRMYTLPLRHQVSVMPANVGTRMPVQ